MEIIKYLIFDYTIEKTKFIDDFLKDKKYEWVEKWFKIREFNNKLERKLGDDKIIGSDIKVKL